MSDPGTTPFPNVSDKLSAPSKKSAFEKARLEAEAKRAREEAETAAVYRDFVASFDDDEPTPPPPSGMMRGGFGGPRGGGMRGAPPSGPGRRHFTGMPGGRGGGGFNGGGGPGAGGMSLPGPPPPNLRKRNLGNAFENDEDEGGVFGSNISEREKRRMRESNTGLLAFENSAPSGKRGPAAGYADDDSGMLPTLLVFITAVLFELTLMMEILIVPNNIRSQRCSYDLSPPTRTKIQSRNCLRAHLSRLIRFG
jgi:U2-associated protein SR140